MKYLLGFLLILLTTHLSAQVPQAFSFQGLLLSEDGMSVGEINIDVRVSILDNISAGTIVYQENHTVLTSAEGLYTLSIGTGIVAVGQFTTIPWADGDKFIKIEIDREQDGTFEDSGTTQLLSVPYALVAGTASAKPEIAVNNTIIAGMNSGTINLNTGITRVPVNYFYQWVDGKPEDVFVEYVGLPDNICIKTFGYNNTSLDFNNSFILDDDGVQTIPGGFLNPQTNLDVCDPNIAVEGGTYNLTIIFRTANVVLDSLSYTLSIESSPVYTTCFSSLPATFSLESNGCDPAVISILDNIVISESTLIAYNISDPIDSSILHQIQIDNLSSPCREIQDLNTDHIPVTDPRLTVQHSFQGDFNFDLFYKIGSPSQQENCSFSYSF